jgi:GxxExxY protein
MHNAGMAVSPSAFLRVLRGEKVFVFPPTEGRRAGDGPGNVEAISCFYDPCFPWSFHRQNAEGTPEMKSINDITAQIVDAAMKVHSALGPGLLESAYEGCMLHELRKRGFKVLDQELLPVIYDGVKIDVGYRIDLLVEDCVIIEVKSVDKLAPIHQAQLLTYLKLSGIKVGLLLNFNVMHMKDGIKRMVNRL